MRRKNVDNSGPSVEWLTFCPLLGPVYQLLLYCTSKWNYSAYPLFLLLQLQLFLLLPSTTSAQLPFEQKEQPASEDMDWVGRRHLPLPQPLDYVHRSPDIRETVRDLTDYLFANYSAYIRPRLDQDESVLVNFYIGLRQVIDVDVKAQQMTLFLWHRQTWFDEFLQWDPSEYDNLTEIFVNPGMIWLPDVIYQNSVNGLADLEQNSPIKIMIMHSGLVNFYRPTIQSTTCEMEVRYFPYDIQHCSFNIGSWMLHENQVDIQVFDYDAGSLAGTGFIEHHEWALLEHTVLREEVTIDVTLNTEQNKLVYPYLQFIFLFERKPEFFEKNVIIPTAMISALSTIAFLLPSESGMFFDHMTGKHPKYDTGEKITFSVTVFLTFCVNLLVVSNHVPASSESFPIIGHYYIACIVIVAISIFITTIILSFHFKGEHMHLNPIPRIVKKFMFNFIAPLLCFEADKTAGRLYRGHGERVIM
ncbi:neuronal acetylcholine receptor subunit alpha-10-like [Convolutriloba macropyga]|uniref:neuronal acetylcholine receptor subunit alpha-10-like n=1 Tax=Convolutriloba macropyga TaxID=536237 RepID=UPI003F527C40